jgi:hypothetical protein
VHGTHRTVGERLGVELRSFERGAVVPEADGVFVDHGGSSICAGSAHYRTQLHFRADRLSRLRHPLC